MAKSIFKSLFDNNAIIARRFVRIVLFIMGIMMLFWEGIGRKIIMYEIGGIKITLFIMAAFLLLLSYDFKHNRL